MFIYQERTVDVIFILLESFIKPLEIFRRVCYCLDEERHLLLMGTLHGTHSKGGVFRVLPKVISKRIIPMNIKMISASVIYAASLLMYSGKPVTKLGKLPPPHNRFYGGILLYIQKKFQHSSCLNRSYELSYSYL